MSVDSSDFKQAAQIAFKSVDFTKLNDKDDSDHQKSEIRRDAAVVTVGSETAKTKNGLLQKIHASAFSNVSIQKITDPNIELILEQLANNDGLVDQLQVSSLPPQEAVLDDLSSIENDQQFWALYNNYLETGDESALEEYIQNNYKDLAKFLDSAGYSTFQGFVEVFLANDKADGSVAQFKDQVSLIYSNTVFASTDANGKLQEVDPNATFVEFTLPDGQKVTFDGEEAGVIANTFIQAYNNSETFRDSVAKLATAQGGVYGFHSFDQGPVDGGITLGFNIEGTDPNTSAANGVGINRPSSQDSYFGEGTLLNTIIHEVAHDLHEAEGGGHPAGHSHSHMHGEKDDVESDHQHMDHGHGPGCGCESCSGKMGSHQEGASVVRSSSHSAFAYNKRGEDGELPNAGTAHSREHSVVIGSIVNEIQDSGFDTNINVDTDDYSTNISLFSPSSEASRLTPTDQQEFDDLKARYEAIQRAVNAGDYEEAARLLNEIPEDATITFSFDNAQVGFDGGTATYNQREAILQELLLQTDSDDWLNTNKGEAKTAEETEHLAQFLVTWGSQDPSNLAAIENAAEYLYVDLESILSEDQQAALNKDEPIISEEDLARLKEYLMKLLEVINLSKQIDFSID